MSHPTAPPATAQRPPPRRAACTIIAKNYLAYARALAESFREHNPDVEFHVLVVDDIDGFIEPAAEPFELLTARSLGITDFARMAFRYDVVELSTAVKPFLLARLIADREITELLYIDPDILVLNSLEPLFTALQHHDIVLTPHTTVDFPDDGVSPSDGMLMIHGLYNLGFIGVRSSDIVDRFLAWWQHKLTTRCIIEPTLGHFVDQKFVDMVPLFFPGVHVEEGCGYNVAYWNLHARHVAHDHGTWTCNGEPLRFYHFSGFDPDSPDRLCRHSPRYTMHNRPDVAPLFEDYRARLKRHGQATCSQWPYTFDTFSDGTRIHRDFRRIFRSQTSAASDSPFAAKDPFSSRDLLGHYKRWHFHATRPIRRLPVRAWRFARRNLLRLLRT